MWSHAFESMISLSPCYKSMKGRFISHTQISTTQFIFPFKQGSISFAEAFSYEFQAIYHGVVTIYVSLFFRMIG